MLLHVLLDLEGAQYSPAWHILLKLYLYYFVRCPICYIRVAKEIGTKLLELNDLQRGRAKLVSSHQNFNLHSQKVSCFSCGMVEGSRSQSRVMSSRIASWQQCGRKLTMKMENH
jgi:hypothetical protein